MITVQVKNGELDKACKRSFPNVKNSFFRLFHIPTNSKDNDYNLDNLPDDEIYEIDCLTGAFMFIKSEALNEAGFWTRPFSCMVKTLICHIQEFLHKK